MHKITKLDAGRYEVTLPLAAGNTTFTALFGAATRAAGEDLELVGIEQLNTTPVQYAVTYQLPAAGIAAAHDKVAHIVEKLRGVVANRRD